MVPRALPWATDLLGFQPAQGRRQGFFRTISTYLISLNFEHSTFRGRLRHRYKGRCANMRRSFGAKHCSSFCSQSEGGEYCGGQTRLKIHQSHAQKRWSCSLRVRGPHFASKVSYNAGAATDDCAGQRKSPLRGRCCQYLIFYLDHPKVMRRPSGIIKSSLRLLQVIDLRPRVALPSAASNATVGRE